MKYTDFQLRDLSTFREVASLFPPGKIMNRTRICIGLKLASDYNEVGQIFRLVADNK